VSITQYTLYGQIYVSSQVGINFSSITSFPVNVFLPAVSTYSGMQGYCIAANIEKHLSETWSIQVGLQAAERGLNYGRDVSFPYFLVTFYAMYIDVPVLMKWRWNISQFSAYLLAGASIGYHINSTLTFKSRIVGSQYDIKKDEVQNAIQPFDIGLIGGIGMLYDISPTVSIFCESRYGLGLLNISQYREISSTRDIRLSAGIRHRIE
jgi:hypothetical protein